MSLLKQAWEPIEKFLDWLSPAKIGALFAIIVALSVLFDIIYLQALGVSIMLAPTSITDHIRSSMIWIPPVLVAVIVTIIVSCIWLSLYDNLVRSKNGLIFIGLTILLLLAMGFLMYVLSQAIWFWVWKLVTPYDFSFAEEALNFLSSTMIQLELAIALIFVVLFLVFPIYRELNRAWIQNPENAMKFRQVEARFLNGFNFLLFMCFFGSTIHISAQLSGSVACAQEHSPTVSDKGTAPLRSFGDNSLVCNCKKNRLEFLRANKGDSMIVNAADSVVVCKQDEQEQDATEQTEIPGADLNPTNSPTPPVASPPPLPGAGQQ